MAELHLISTASSENPAEADIVFVHGLGDHWDETWRAAGASETWLQWFAEELPSWRIWTIEYDSSLFGGSPMFFQDRAVNLLDLLTSHHLGARPLFFVAHSLGGIIVKQMLRTAEYDERFQSVIAATAGVIFLATPHQGASLATLAKALHLPSKLAPQLVAEEATLRELYNWYRKRATRYGIHTRAYVEQHPGWGFIVVSPSSANPGVGDQPIPLDADHFTIAKPLTRGHQLVGSVRGFLTDTMTQTQANASAASPPPVSSFQAQLEVHQKRFTSLARLAGHMVDTGEPIYLDDVYVHRSAEQRIVESVARASRTREGAWISIEGDAGNGKTSLLWHVHREFRSDLSMWVIPFGAQNLSSGFSEEQDWLARVREADPARSPLVLVDTVDLIMGRDDQALTGGLNLLRAHGAVIVTTCRQQEAKRLAEIGAPDHRIPLGRYSEPEAQLAIWQHIKIIYRAATEEQWQRQFQDVWALVEERQKVQGCLTSTTFSGQRQLLLPPNDNYLVDP